MHVAPKFNEHSVYNVKLLIEEAEEEVAGSTLWRTMVESGAVVDAGRSGGANRGSTAGDGRPNHVDDLVLWS